MSLLSSLTLLIWEVVNVELVYIFGKRPPASEVYKNEADLRKRERERERDNSETICPYPEFFN
jgi:hypothetical protein